MNAIVDFLVPDIGDYKDVPVIEVLVDVGDTLAIDTSVITLESEKATIDVPASVAGTVAEVLVVVGDRVSQGSLILRINTLAVPPADNALAATAQLSIASSLAVRIQRPIETARTSTTQPAETPHGACGPAVRRLARELDVNLALVTGSGNKSRILKEDVVAYVQQTMQRSSTTTAKSRLAPELELLPWPKVDFEKYGSVQRHPKSRIQKISAANLHRNWVMMPHVTNFDEADITDLEAFRQQVNAEQGTEGTKVTMLSFLIKAVVSTLQAFPAFNNSLDGDEIVQKSYWHIGFAVDTPNGLVVPVIRDADQKDVFALACECADLSRSARDGKLRPEQMQGGSFTISSLGGIGGTGFTPIINAPEVAILGVNRASIKPGWNGTQFEPRLTLPLSLSWDHRAVDGASAARLLVHLGLILRDFRRVTL